MRALLIYKYLTDENPERTEFTAREFDTACPAAIERYGPMKPSPFYVRRLEQYDHWIANPGTAFQDTEYYVRAREDWIRTGGYDQFWNPSYVHPVLARLCKSPQHPSLQRRKDPELGIYVYTVTARGQDLITKYLEN